MTDAVKVELSPRWRQAVEDFFAAGFKSGDIVPHDWLEQHFGMAALKEDASLTPAEFRERQFKWLQCIEAFKQELLEVHQVYLASVYGEGYRVTPPGEQTRLAMEKFEGDAKRAFRNTAMRLRNVRAAELTDAQRRENVDAVGRLSMLRGMQKTALE